MLHHDPNLLFDSGLVLTNHDHQSAHTIIEVVASMASVAGKSAVSGRTRSSGYRAGAERKARYCNPNKQEAHQECLFQRHAILLVLELETNVELL